MNALALRDLPDRDLVRRCQGGEREAFDELFQRHQDKIYNFVYRSCGHAEDAGDITQRVFINVFRKIGEFKGDSAFSTWIYRIAFNQSVSFARGRKQREVPLYTREDEPAAEPAEERSPSAPLETEETRRKVQQALDQLGEEDRNIILLKDLQGHSYDDIAEILGIPKGTVRSRLHRARMDLKTKLKVFMGTLQA